ncbi:hypothetical protein HPB47_028441, partial [Ixodes persulcatus]
RICLNLTISVNCGTVSTLIETAGTADSEVNVLRDLGHNNDAASDEGREVGSVLLGLGLRTCGLHHLISHRVCHRHVGTHPLRSSLPVRHAGLRLYLRRCRHCSATGYATPQLVASFCESEVYFDPPAKPAVSAGGNYGSIARSRSPLPAVCQTPAHFHLSGYRTLPQPYYPAQFNFAGLSVHHLQPLPDRRRRF